MNEVVLNLWQGSAPDPMKTYKEFDVIVLCALEIQPKLRRFSGVVLRTPFDDTLYPSQKEVRTANRAAGCVAEFLDEGKRVLVTCAAGLNRSGLVVARAIQLGHPEMHWLEIVDRVKAARGIYALSNSTFVRIVKDRGHYAWNTFMPG